MEQKKRRKSFIFFLILSSLILLADYFRLLKPVKGFLEKKLVIPVREKLVAKPLSPTAANSTNSCQEKDLLIETLKAQVAGLKEENLAARKLLGAPLPPNWQFLPAKVISVGEEGMLIDQGGTEGVKDQMIVLAEGVYLGKVQGVSVEAAKVALLTSPDSRAVVKILAKDDLSLAGKGLLFGKGNNEMEVKEILAAEEIKEGDLVVAADTAASSNLLIGKVTSVNYKKGDVFKTALVKREIDLNNLTEVFLVKL